MTLAAGESCAEHRQIARGITGTDVCARCVVLGAVAGILNAPPPQLMF